jgi:uncharacterized LabA/DUF88 family protein
MSTTHRPRGGLFVDGFNLYHAIADLQEPYLKWVSLRRLGERVAKQFSTEMQEIVFCTAFFPGDFGKKKRHETYIAALQAEGVVVRYGHTTKEPSDCRRCGAVWDQPREKETDINVALSLYEAFVFDRIDIAFLVTADTDQAATLKAVSRSFPAKQVVVLTPPGRRESTHLKDSAHKSAKLSKTDIDLSVFPATIQPKTGRLVVRPSEYAPPKNWVHPDERPKKGK